MLLLVAMSRWRSRRVVARRGVLAAPSAARGAPWLYRCVRVELRTLVCGSRRGLVCLAVRLWVDMYMCVMCSPSCL